MKLYGACSELAAKVAPNIFNHKISREISHVRNYILNNTSYIELS